MRRVRLIFNYFNVYLTQKGARSLRDDVGNLTLIRYDMIRNLSARILKLSFALAIYPTNTPEMGAMRRINYQRKHFVKGFLTFNLSHPFSKISGFFPLFFIRFLCSHKSKSGCCRYGAHEEVRSSGRVSGKNRPD